MLNFKPPILFQNRHFQTIWPSIAPIKNNLEKFEEKVFVTLDDGDQLLLKINHVSQATNAVILVHGLEGSSESRYMLQVAEALISKGYSVVRMNLRNCGGTEKNAKKLYNAGMSHDLLQVLSYLHKYAWSQIDIVGFSLGANVVGKFCGENDKNKFDLINNVLLVSPPLDLYKGIQLIQKGFGKIYNQHFTKLLKQKYLKKCQLYPEIYRSNDLIGVNDLFTFDDKITGPHFGFKGALDYYANSSCGKFIQNSNFSIQMLISLDDPIVDAQACVDLKNDNPAHIDLYITQKGGHVGFYGYNHHTKSNAMGWLADFVVQRLYKS